MNYFESSRGPYALFERRDAREAPCHCWEIAVTDSTSGIKVGHRAEFSKTVSADDILKFAEVSGDTNPLHCDPEYARRTRFGECIVHGMLGAGFISAAIGTLAPYGAAIYLTQTLRFLRPINVGDTIRAVAEVKKIDAETRQATLNTVCYNQHNEQVVTGNALVLLERLT
jgi:acyl dehydratase